MKKKILFVIPSLRSGGAEKSLVSLLSLFDYEKYEVDLLSFRRDGLFWDSLPAEINSIYDTTDYEMFDGSIKKSLPYFVKRFNVSALIDLIRYRKAFKEKDADIRELKAWYFLKKRLPKVKKEYDCAIAYLEGNSCDFVADCVNAKKKILYIHNDLKKLPCDKTFYNRFLKNADKIVTVSEVCLESLKSEFPAYKKKCFKIENIVSRKIICNCVQDDVYERNGKTVLLTVGRCSEQKNIELAVRTCKELKNRNIDVQWYHIGKGSLFESVKNYAKELGVENEFIMLGEKSNPYPYMAQCDIYVQPSRFEGKSIAIDEVKCLCKPIVVTNFPSVTDQITYGVNGIICEMNEKDMADKLEMLIDDSEFRDKLSNQLKSENIGNESEIQKLYALIEE